MATEISISHANNEETIQTLDFNPQLLTGETVTGCTVTHVPPSGTPETITPTVLSGIVYVPIPAGLAAGLHLFHCVATTSNPNNSPVIILKAAIRFPKFTFDPGLATDKDLVRFHIGDTEEDGYFLEDATIQYFVTTTSMEEAVLTCIRHIIALLSLPNFVLDWLEVTNDKAREGYEQLLGDKEREFGIRTITASSTVSLPSRADSYMTTTEQDGSP